MITAWHVVRDDWDGGDLRSWDDQHAAGACAVCRLPDYDAVLAVVAQHHAGTCECANDRYSCLPCWRWEYDPTESATAGCISLYSTLAEALAHRDEYGGRVLRVTLTRTPSRDVEGYWTIEGSIPASQLAVL